MPKNLKAELKDVLTGKIYKMGSTEKFKDVIKENPNTPII